ncbi:hypothetical protein IF2G_09276 [Cordyceps javanica]|nr:hypothetical protein IF2G_09276 [Cordyceps javanica]
MRIPSGSRYDITTPAINASLLILCTAYMHPLISVRRRAWLRGKQSIRFLGKVFRTSLPVLGCTRMSTRTGQPFFRPSISWAVRPLGVGLIRTS